MYEHILSLQLSLFFSEGSQNAVASQVRARRRIAKMLIVVVVVFILCFLPVYTWNIIRLSVAINPMMNFTNELEFHR